MGGAQSGVLKSGWGSSGAQVPRGAHITKVNHTIWVFPSFGTKVFFVLSLFSMFFIYVLLSVTQWVKEIVPQNKFYRLNLMFITLRPSFWGPGGFQVPPTKTTSYYYPKYELNFFVGRSLFNDPSKYQLPNQDQSKLYLLLREVVKKMDILQSLLYCFLSLLTILWQSSSKEEG